MRRVAPLALLCLFAAETLWGGNYIREWSGHYVLGQDYSINQQTRTVTLHKNSVWSVYWRFEADDDQTNAPGDIDEIRIDRTDDLGYVRLRVQADGSQGRQYAARDVKKIDLLTDADNDTEISNMIIQRHFGANGPMLADDVRYAVIYGDLLGDIHPSSNIPDLIYIGGNLSANITANALATINVAGAGPHTGNITRWVGDQSADITIANTYSGDIYIAGKMGGKLNVGGDLSGTLTCGTFLDGDVTVGGNFSGGIETATHMWRNIAIGGNFSGQILARGNLYGEIRANGSLANGTGYDIEVKGSMGSDAAIAIDYDGWDSSDNWASGATVRIGSTTYSGNSPAARIYEITSCRGDMNNDGSVDFDDIDPFVLAIGDPADYDAAFPGLLGSLPFHGDLNCDDSVDFDDIDPIVERITEECCDPGCPGCNGFAPPTLPSPEELAKELRNAVSEERFDELVKQVTALCESLGDSDRGEYWQAVLEALLS